MQFSGIKQYCCDLWHKKLHNKGICYITNLYDYIRICFIEYESRLDRCMNELNLITWCLENINIEIRFPEMHKRNRNLCAKVLWSKWLIFKYLFVFVYPISNAKNLIRFRKFDFVLFMNLFLPNWDGFYIVDEGVNSFNCSISPFLSYNENSNNGKSHIMLVQII